MLLIKLVATANLFQEFLIHFDQKGNKTCPLDGRGSLAVTDIIYVTCIVKPIKISSFV